MAIVGLFFLSFGQNGVDAQTDENVTVGVTVVGPGTVTLRNAGMQCREGNVCRWSVPHGHTIYLDARPNSDADGFDYWSGCDAVAGNPKQCSFVADSPREITAAFYAGYVVSVTKIGTGSGTVISLPLAINCGTDCTNRYARSVVSVTLRATADSGSTFKGWSGLTCTNGGNSSSECSFGLGGNRSISAEFSKSGSTDPDCKFTPSSISATGSLKSTFSWKGATGSEFNVYCTGPVPMAKVIDSAALSQVEFTFDESARGKQEICRVTDIKVEKKILCENVTLNIESASSNGKCTDDSTQKCAADCAKETGYEDGGTGTCEAADPNKPLECCKKKDSSTGKCTDTTGQICSADCSKESGYESGGTGTCSDSAKPICCKTKSSTTTTTTSTLCTGSENAWIVPCGRSCDVASTTDIDESAICTLCHLLVLIRNITTWIFMVMTYIAFAVLVAMGILYIVSTGNTQLISMAKNGIWAALVGFAIVLLGWVAINVILMVLADGALGTDTAAFSFKTNGSWFTYSCDAKSKYVRTGIDGVTSGGGGGTSTNPGGNGTCDTVKSGPCSVESLKSTCFGNNAETMSRLCNKESKGVPGKESGSGVDICSNYANRSFSGGLFQINVFANGSKLGDSRCNNLGSKGTCANRRSSDGVCLAWNCTINNLDDFDYCMGLTFSADSNIKVACSLSNNGTNLTPWACSANKCGLGGTSSNFCK